MLKKLMKERKSRGRVLLCNSTGNFSSDYKSPFFLIDQNKQAVSISFDDIPPIRGLKVNRENAFDYKEAAL